jgi:lipopolysaccharide/colanic/teichoic acid biosynthesis glycosyltransferase
MPIVGQDELDAPDVVAAAPAAAPRSRGRLCKHAADRVVAACGLLVAAPLITVLALALRYRYGGPVLRRTIRLGEGGRPIRVFTLTAGGATAALPQLWNVLRGELSLVGPRPRQVDLAAPPVRPGLTGLAQLEQLQRALTIGDQLELDDIYARTWSLAGDARIVARTLRRAVR